MIDQPTLEFHIPPTPIILSHRMKDSINASSYFSNISPHPHLAGLLISILAPPQSFTIFSNFLRR